MDDEYLNGYAKLCGIYATGVYNSLCRHADYHTQECFPSIERMATQLGVSEKSVQRGLKALVDWHIILKEKTRHPKNNQWVNNSYTLLDKSVWKSKPQVYMTDGVQETNSTEPEDSQGKSQRSITPSKVTHKKVTHIKDSKAVALQGNQTNLLIDKFKNVNPLTDELFRNTTERKAIDYLVGKFGYEKVAGMIDSLANLVSQPYAPKITKPSELRRLLPKLILFYKQNQNKPTGKYEVNKVH